MLALGCTETAPESADCTDAACIEAQVLTLVKTDPDSAAARLRALPPLERIAVLDAVMEQDAARAAELCPVLEPATAIDRCRERAARGHLWDKPRTAATTSWTSVHSGGLAAVPRVTPALANVNPLPPSECPEDHHQKRCIRSVAQKAAASGDATAALAACRALPADTEQRECAFAAAERLIGADPERYAAASELCLVSGDFAGQCLGHLARGLARLAPPASQGAAEAWAPVALAADTVKARWAPVDAEYAPIAAQAVWSEATLRAYSLIDVVSGDPLDAVPPEAVPHVRAAAAARLLRKLPKGDHERRDLDSIVTEVAAALAHRAPDDASSKRPQNPMGAVDLWPTDRPGDAAMTAIPYMATSRRTRADDPTADLTICVLEAAARSPEDWSAQLREGADHTDPTVRWTAQRLLTTTLEPRRPMKGGKRPPSQRHERPSPPRP